MEQHLFEIQLKAAKTDEDYAQLLYDVIEDSTDDNSEESAINMLNQVHKILENEFDLTYSIDEEICFFSLIYGYTDYHLDATKLILEKLTANNKINDEAVQWFYGFIGTKLDFNNYNCPFIVKLYLLCSAYIDTETYITMNENLIGEMFEEHIEYTSLQSESESITLTKEIFKDIHKYDYCVEMTTQQLRKCGCWILHIYHKESKIEVARYN